MDGATGHQRVAAMHGGGAIPWGTHLVGRARSVAAWSCRPPGSAVATLGAAGPGPYRAVRSLCRSMGRGGRRTAPRGAENRGCVRKPTDSLHLLTQPCRSTPCTRREIDSFRTQAPIRSRRIAADSVRARGGRAESLSIRCGQGATPPPRCGRAGGRSAGDERVGRIGHPLLQAGGVDGDVGEAEAAQHERVRRGGDPTPAVGDDPLRAVRREPVGQLLER